MNTRFSVSFLAACAALLALGCPGQDTPPAQTPAAARPAPKKAEPVVWRESKSGLGFRLSDAAPEEQARAEPVVAAPLPEAEVQKIFARVPPLAPAPDDEKGFALRDKSRPAPRAGKTVEAPFPPPATRPPVAASSGPLRVTRHAPEGEVAVAPNVSVSFSAPMIAITSHDDLAKAPSPVTMTPQPPGKWRWLGSQTIVFDPDLGRLPMSTDYRIEVKAGTRAAGGSALARTEAWTVATPTLHLDASAPVGTGVELEPTFFAAFNQGIDPAAVLAVTKVTAGQDVVPVALVANDDVEANASLRAMAKAHAAKKGEAPRWLAFKAQRPLPKNTAVTVTFPEGTPAAEGPKKAAAQTFSFRTYGPLHLVTSRCGSYDCPPLAPFTLTFANVIDAAAFDKSWVHVTPELPDAKISVSGAQITIQGRSKGRTKYTVTVDGALKDRFGQTLARPASAEFKVEPAEPMLFSDQQPLIVLDPAAHGKLSVFSVNRPALRVRLYRVRPEDFEAFLKWRRDWDDDGVQHTPPGRLVQDQVVRPTATPDALVETSIPLAPALGAGGFGQVVAVVEPATGAKKDRWQAEWVRQWIEVTDLALDAFADDRQAYAWSTSLTTGAPVEGVEVSLLPRGGAAKTAADGVARFDLPSAPDAVITMVAKKGSDLAMLAGSWDALRLQRTHTADAMRWFTFDDRRMYKPGEEVHVKGWLRKAQGGAGGDLTKAAGVQRVTWEARDPRGSKIVDGAAELDASGGFDFAFKLPKDVNLGQATIALDANGAKGAHYFQVEEFRRPEFEVGVQISEGPHVVGKHAVATVAAKYYSGGGLAAAETTWRVRRSDAHFAPPNLSSFSFGKPVEWAWWSARTAARTRPDSETWSARTSAAGEHRLRIDFDAVDPPYPMTLDVEASVADVNRQQWTARGNVLVHPADVTAGLRTQRAFVRAGEAIPVEAIVSDLDGNLIAGTKLTLKSTRMDTEWTPGDGYHEVERDPQTCDVVSAKEPVRCSLPTKRGGRYAITTVVTDVYGRKSQTRVIVWVMSDDWAPNRELQKDALQILPDKTSYAPGDTAELLVMAPFAPAEGVLTLERQGIVHFERIKLAKTSDVVRVKLDRSHFPAVIAAVRLVGVAPRENAHGEPDSSLPTRPAQAFAAVELKVPPKERTLAVKATPRDAQLDPGGATTIDVDVEDASGRPAPGAVVAVAVVDESILALTGAGLPDPIAAFYQLASGGVQAYEARDLVWLARVPDVQLRAKVPAEPGSFGVGTITVGGAGFGRLGGEHKSEASPARMRSMAAPAPQKAMAKPAASAATGLGDKDGDGLLDQSGALPEIKLRKDLSALAAWAPHVVVDASGHATLPVKLPENLTRYRVIAVGAADENWFGAGESTITARLPLMVRPSAPRFLNFGDRLELPIVLQNQTSAPLDVAVAARATNARMLDSGGRRVLVPANDRVEVRVPVAAQKAGTARFQVVAASGRMGDAAELSLPVWTPATTEAFATYGTIDEGAIAQPVSLPSGAVKEFGGVEITTSSTGLQGLTDAVLYLVRYPFDCNEQIASRMLAIAALKDVLGAFQADGVPPPAVLADSMKQDFEKLRTRQHWSGGFSFWGSNYEPNPWVSIHVAHAIQRAMGKGYVPPADLAPRARRYLAEIERHIPKWYLPEHRRAIVAYALYVRHRFGDSPVKEARALVREAGGVEKLPLEALGWLLPILGPDPTADAEVQAIRRLLANRVTETAGAAHFATSYDDGEYVLLHSDRRADGVLLEALIGDQKDSDLIPKLVTGLLGHRKAGRWSSTQENAFVLLALDRYFQTYEKATPNFVARAWVGEKLAMERTFQGRSTDRAHVTIPLSYLASLAQPRQDLVVQKDGVGRLYYRIGMQYAPADLRPPPTEQGFSVSRVYEGAENPGDVRRDADGTYHVKAGAKVRVRVSMVAPARRTHVALVDPLPAGLEPMNPALAVTGSLPADPKALEREQGGVPWWWTRTWYEHQNMRDERVEAFASLLWDGVYDYTYVAVATTPGVFVAPPPKAEEMYSPETFGRGAGDRVIVE